MQPVLRDYQEKAVDFLCKNGSAALFADMGMGKCLMTLSAMCRLMLDSFKVYKVLVVAPLRVALISWPEEMKKWDFDQKITSIVVHGSHKKRLLHHDAHGADVTFINYDGLRWLSDNAVGMPKYDMLVLDESTFIKSHQTKRFKILRSLRKHISRCVILTGTPMPNSMLDLWAQMYMIDEGERLGSSFYKYRNKYFMKADYFGYKWALKKGSKEEITALISDVCMVLKAEDHLDMPELRRNELKIKLSAKRMMEYQELEKDFFLMLENGEAVEAFSSAALSMKLRQYVAGFVYDDMRNPIRVHDERLKVLKELIESLNGKPLLVAVQFQEEIQMVRDYFKDPDLPAIYSKTSTKQSVEYISAWNKRELPILMAHPASIGHGLNLQSGGCNMLWYSLTWSLEHFEQTNARLWRQGQEDTVFMHYIVAHDTIDEAIADTIGGKEKSQQELLRRLKQWKDKQD